MLVDWAAVLVVTSDDEVDVTFADGVVVVPVWTAIPEHALVRASAASRPGSRFIRASLCHRLPDRRRMLGDMFGPLNGVRTALVIAAALAAGVSFVAGYAEAALVLTFGVLLHGLGWLYLYSIRERVPSD